MTSFLDQLALELADVSAGQRVPIPLFPLGDWTSAKYASLPLNRDLADELIAGFEAGILGTEPVLDSSGNHNTAAPAAGWFKKLYVAPTKDGGEMLFGDAELTDLGASMLNAGLYKYDSIEIGPVVDNASGAKTDNVFRSATLTNTPVLRMLPKILDAADAIAMSEPVEILLSEISLTTTAEDDGTPAELHPADSDAGSHPAKGDEGQPVTLDEGHAAQRGSDHMNPKILQALKLAEGADEAAIEAAVVTLSEERDAEKARADAAEVKLGEVEKATHDADVTARLDKAVELAEITPGERTTLAEKDDAQRDAFLEARKGYKAIVLGEVGTSEAGTTDDDPTVALDKVAAKLAEERGIDYGEAMNIALAEDPALATRYHNRDL